MDRRTLLLSSFGLALAPFPSAKAMREPTKWALLIGIDRYGAGVRPLVGAVADAVALGKTLVEVGGFPKDHVTVLTTSGERKPTREEIFDQLDALSGKVQKGDTIFVFFSGHGCEDPEANETYLLPMNARTTSGRVLRDTGLTTTRFTEYLRRLPAGLLLLTFDMCRVEIGKADETTLTDGIQTRGLDFTTAKPGEPDEELPQVVVTWWACSPSEKAYEMVREKRGYFSYFLERGLRGEAASTGGQVTLASLTRFVGPKVTKEVRSREGRKQTPRFDPRGLSSPDDLDRFVLATKAIAPVVVQPKPARSATLRVTGTLPKSVVYINGSKIAGKTLTRSVIDPLTVSVVVKTPGYPDTSSTGTLIPGAETSVAFTFAQPVAPKPQPSVRPKPVSVKPSAAGGRARFASAASRIRTQYPALASYLVEMCAIPGGTFQMGSKTGGDSDEKPVHAVTLSPYFLGRTPVTVAVWKEYAAAKLGGKMPELPTYGTVWKGGWDSVLDHPVVNVSWNDCVAFCSWASGVSGIVLSLPTEAQWERAARGGKEGLAYPWGKSMDDSKCWYTKTSGEKGTASVSRGNNVFVNGYGLVDMSGNVWQWCLDWYGAYPPGSATNPTGASSGNRRVLRGGSWSNDAVFSRCAYRNRYYPADRYIIVGLRLHA